MANGAALASRETTDVSWFAMPTRTSLSDEPKVQLPTQQGTMIEVTLSGSDAPWVWPTLQILSDLCRLDRNWNSYGALPLQHDHLMSALQFIQYLSTIEISEPVVVPTNQGGVQFEWELPTVEVEVRTLPQSRISSYIEGRAGQTPRSEEISLSNPGRMLALARLLEQPAP